MSKRIGITKAEERLLRFYARGNPFVSRQSRLKGREAAGKRQAESATKGMRRTFLSLWAPIGVEPLASLLLKVSHMVGGPPWIVPGVSWGWASGT